MLTGVRKGLEGLFEIIVGMRQWGDEGKRESYFIMILMFLDLILNVQFHKSFRSLRSYSPFSSLQGAAGHQGAVGSPGPAGPRVSATE